MVHGGYPLVTPYPQLGAALSPASTPVTSCKFVFSGTHTSSYPMRLGEVRFFDGDGDVLADAVSTASNPGGNMPSHLPASKTIDGANSQCWQDSNGVPSTLQPARVLLLHSLLADFLR